MKSKFFKSFIISLVVFLVTGFYFTSNYVKNNIEEVVVVDQETGEEKIVKRPKEDIDFSLFEDEITFLMLGVDEIQGREKELGVRSDTMMVMKANFETGELNVLSIPRDTRVLIYGKKDKINHAHSYEGVDLSLKTVNDFLDTDIKYYVKVDYKAVEEIVNAIGGVEIDVPRRMEYYDPDADFRVDLDKGLQTLDGKQSLQFLRWRNNNAMTVGYREGDVGRIKMQQYFLKELVKQSLSPKNITKLPSIAKTYFSRIDTNIPINQILGGMAMTSNLDSENMRTETVPGHGEYIDNISYFIYYENQLNTLVEDMGLR